MVYIKLFIDYLDAIEPLGDAERGRLFTALMEYAKTGEVPQLGGNERFIFPMMKAQIDRDNATQEEISVKRSNAAKSKGKQNEQVQASASKGKQKREEKDKDKEEDKDKDEIIPPVTPLFADPELQVAFDSWLAYKKERREGYKPQGLRALTTEVRNNSERYGSSAVARLIRECMANGWKGIIFERLEKTQRKQEQPKSFADMWREMPDD